MKALIWTVLVVTVGLTGALQAQNLAQWGSVGGWDVMVDPTLGNGCLIQAAYDDGSVVRIGYDRHEDTGYVAAFNQAWGDIEAGETYPVTFALDSALYDAEAAGIYLNGVPGAYIYFDNPGFLFDIARKFTMTVYNEGEEAMSIDLNGSYVGLEAAAIECQDEMG